MQTPRTQWKYRTLHTRTATHDSRLEIRGSGLCEPLSDCPQSYRPCDDTYGHPGAWNCHNATLWNWAYCRRTTQNSSRTTRKLQATDIRRCVSFVEHLPLSQSSACFRPPPDDPLPHATQNPKKANDKCPGLDRAHVPFDLVAPETRT